ncbi:hypothetical protein [Clostridium chromiireducens]|nr:hypothetical protein [Clostridium chromiireducens]
MASKTIELRKDIISLLKSVCNGVFYRRATDKTPYPYVVISINDIAEAKVLTIDCWDNDSDTSVIETLADNIESVLDKQTITNENHSITFYSNEDRKWIDDEDKNISRINETFEIRYFGKEI